MARYTQGLGIDAPLEVYESGASYYYHADALGTITTVTKRNGSVANTYTYTSFGNPGPPNETVANPFQFTAREYDSETKLYFYRARYYEPLFGRFLSEDKLGDVLSRSQYVYVGNSPVNFVDPRGLHRIFFDGSQIELYDDSGKEVLRCKATSGKPGMFPGDMWRPWEGPIPQGNYSLDPQEFSEATGLRHLVRDRFGLWDWGKWRVPLHPLADTNTYGRGGFFMHGGRRPGSAGCIDVGSCDQKIFDAIGHHIGAVDVQVRYVNFKAF